MIGMAPNIIFPFSPATVSFVPFHLLYSIISYSLLYLVMISSCSCCLSSLPPWRCCCPGCPDCLNFALTFISSESSIQYCVQGKKNRRNEVFHFLMGIIHFYFPIFLFSSFQFHPLPSFYPRLDLHLHLCSCFSTFSTIFIIELFHIYVCTTDPIRFLAGCSLFLAPCSLLSLMLLNYWICYYKFSFLQLA